MIHQLDRADGIVERTPNDSPAALFQFTGFQARQFARLLRQQPVSYTHLRAHET